MKRANGALGITVTGSDDPFDPIIISGLAKVIYFHTFYVLIWYFRVESLIGHDVFTKVTKYSV